MARDYDIRDPGAPGAGVSSGQEREARIEAPEELTGLELIAGQARVEVLDLRPDGAGGLIARLSGAALSRVLDAAFGSASLELWGQGRAAHPLEVTEIHMSGDSSEVMLEFAGSARARH